MLGISFGRIAAVFIKELIQMRRDRLTFAMIIGIPIVQLVLFGYAINSDPKHLPTASAGVGCVRFPRAPTGHGNKIMSRAIGVHPHRYDPGLLPAVAVFRGQKCGSRAVAEQQRRFSIRPIQEPRFRFRRRDQARPRLSAPDHRIGHGKAVQESRTGGGQVEGHRRFPA